ncbi:hypothetical protein EJB05_28440 [Eragrostis curvula]|uniref:Uncharacterized protein n=1 Tax=Eragrostis curvula TaxID=38414 RepID=A0A5J9UPY9_9POAL|nr:hypothetical protein EJB05_28440 [Eragrostis curvula]
MDSPASDPTSGYYVGRPTNSDEQKAPAPPAENAVDEQVNASIPNIPGYYHGRVEQGRNAAGDQSSAAAATQHNGEPSFLAKW